VGTKKSIILLILLVYAIAVVAGLRYYRFMKEDTAYCSMCHIMEEGYRSWESSAHYLIICQECHDLSVMEGNKLLLARYVQGAKQIEQDHGRRRPWDQCVECHLGETAQGAVTLRESYGHARHVFMRNITCDGCHTGAEHEFRVDHTRCQGCHPGHLVHGMGTAGTYCLNCHDFIQASSRPVPVERCFRCHDDIPTRGVMADIKCYECHHPHEQLRIENADCLGACHGNETQVGQHGVHVERLGLGCMDCHRPHSWTVGKEQARGLCDRCHPLKDPRTFIY
jgi:hypothetical protein